jgi:hypothetical protein
MLRGWNPLNYVHLNNSALAPKKPTDATLSTVTVTATGTISTSDSTVVRSKSSNYPSINFGQNGV